MPNMDGLELCRRLRAISQVPIIILSAKGEEPIKVEALDIGADDFVTKPFGIDELLARLRAALRRAKSQPGTQTEETLIEVGDLRVDLESRSVSVCGREVHLTPKEFDLLVYFIKHAGKVLTHRTLLGAVWGGLRRARSIPASFCRQSSQEAETNPPRRAIFLRTVGRIPLHSKRVVLNINQHRRFHAPQDLKTVGTHSYAT